MSTVTIVDRDMGMKQLMKELDQKSTSAVYVGIQGKEADAREEGGELTVGEVASQHEFGLGVPERSWLRGWFDENIDRIHEDLRKVTQKILKLELTKEQALQLLGVKYVAEIQKRIVAGIEPPNAPSTIKAKGSSTPLIDTGQLKSAITFVLKAALEGATE